MLLASIFFAMAVGSISTAGDIIYVKAGGIGSGTSWGDGYGELQDALETAGSGDEIWVAEGTYYPTSNYVLAGDDPNRLEHFRMISGVAIYGGFPPSGSAFAKRDPNQYETILSGDIGVAGIISDNCYHVFYHPNEINLEASAILDGFTVTGGNADGSGDHNDGGGMYNWNSSPTVTNCTFIGNSADIGCGIANWENSSPTVISCVFTSNLGLCGGGIANWENSSPTVINCIFTGNSANWGGGIDNDGSSSPIVTGCTFSGNTADDGGGGMDNWRNSNPTIIDCTFTDNSADEGGGIYNRYHSNTTVTNCVFSGNSAENGGGIYNYDHSSPTVTGCIFTGNSAKYVGWPPGPGSGGGIYNNDNSSPSVTNCTFSGNSATSGGGGMDNSSYSNPIITNCTFTGNTASCGGGMDNSGYSNPIITNCTFSGNSASYGGGMDNYNYSNPIVTNCILWGNTASSEGNEICNGTFQDSSIPVISYCDIGGSGGSGTGWDVSLGTDGGGNIDIDPLFIDVESGDYHLSVCSPCIDTGTNTPPGGLPSTDIEGQSRPIDGDNDTVAVADMGAYEALLSTEPVIYLSKNNFYFEALVGVTPANQTLTINNRGAGILDWSISEDCDWLQVIPSNGSSTGDPNEVSLIVESNDMPAGIYNCQMIISGVTAMNSPYVVSVELEVFPLILNYTAESYGYARCRTINGTQDADSNNDFSANSTAHSNARASAYYYGEVIPGGPILNARADSSIDVSVVGIYDNLVASLQSDFWGAGSFWYSYEGGGRAYGSSGYGYGYTSLSGTVQIGVFSGYPESSSGLELNVSALITGDEPADWSLLDWWCKIWDDNPESPLLVLNAGNMSESLSIAGGEILNIELYHKVNKDSWPDGGLDSGLTIDLEVPSPSQADINNDGKVNIIDLAILSSQWDGPGGVPSADIVPVRGDGVVNLLDFSFLARHWQESVPIPSDVNLDLAFDNHWMYQNLPTATASNLTANLSIIYDPAGNSSYTYDWEFILPNDVTLEPVIIGPSDANCLTFASRGCDEPGGISGLGETFQVKVTVTGNDHGNTGSAELQFGIALLGDVNNDTVVDLADRSIINAFWNDGSAGSFTLRDCDVNCDGLIDLADRSITNAIWCGTLGSNSITNPCPLR